MNATAPYLQHSAIRQDGMPLYTACNLTMEDVAILRELMAERVKELDAWPDNRHHSRYRLRRLLLELYPDELVEQAPDQRPAASRTKELLASMHELVQEQTHLAVVIITAIDMEGQAKTSFSYHQGICPTKARQLAKQAAQSLQTPRA